MTPTGALRPLGDRVLVRRMEEREETDGGLLIPETAREHGQLFEVAAVGQGRYYSVGPTRSQVAAALAGAMSIDQLGEALDALEHLGLCFGQRMPMAVKERDVVLLGRYSGTDVKVGGIDYSIVREDEIMAVVPRGQTVSV